VERGGQTLARFLGDFDERRVLKIGDPTRPGGSGVQEYVYNGSRLVLDVENGQPTARYEWTNEELVSLLQSGGARRYFALDGLETVLALTDEAGQATDRLSFDAWGVPKEGTDFGTSGSRFAFTSHRFDTELNLYYADGRKYSPTIGRFISQDTLALDPNNPETWNLLSYANANPTRYVDPSGHANETANQEPDEGALALQAAKAPFENPELAAAREEANRAHADAAHVVREENWLDKVGRKARIAGTVASAMWNDLWNHFHNQIDDEAEAAGKASIRQRPPSENTRTRQAAAEALADSDPTQAAVAREVRPATSSRRTGTGKATCAPRTAWERCCGAREPARRRSVLMQGLRHKRENPPDELVAFAPVFAEANASADAPRPLPASRKEVTDVRGLFRKREGLFGGWLPGLPRPRRHERPHEGREPRALPVRPPRTASWTRNIPACHGSCSCRRRAPERTACSTSGRSTTCA